MTNGTNCQTAEDIMLPLPVPEDLPGLRGKIKKAKSPTLPVGAHWSNSRVGAYSTSEGPEGMVITWKTVNGPERSALFNALGVEPEHEHHRLELGWMIANMLRIEAVRMLREIPGPKEAMAEANLYHREEDRWRYWALLGTTMPPKKARRTDRRS